MMLAISPSFVMLLAQLSPAAPPAQKPKADFLESMLPMLGYSLVLVFMAAIIWFVIGKLRKTADIDSAANTHGLLSELRKWKESGQLTPEEYQKIKSKLGAQLKEDLNLNKPKAGDKTTPPNVENISEPTSESPPVTEEVVDQAPVETTASTDASDASESNSNGEPTSKETSAEPTVEVASASTSDEPPPPMETNGDSTSNSTDAADQTETEPVSPPAGEADADEPLDRNDKPT